jgi:uncharacterized protein YxeA
VVGRPGWILAHHSDEIHIHMRTLATVIALLVVVTASLFVWGGETTVGATHALASEVKGQDVRKTPSATPRLEREREQSTKQEGLKRATIIGLMMLLGAQHGR